jgi:hypothetical protein
MAVAQLVTDGCADTLLANDSGLPVSYEVGIRKKKRNPVIARALPSHREN